MSRDARKSLVIWQTGTNAAIRHMPLDKFDKTLRGGLALGKSLGADFVLMNLQYVPAVVAAPDKEAYEKVMADAATGRRWDELPVTRAPAQPLPLRALAGVATAAAVARARWQDWRQGL